MTCDCVDYCQFPAQCCLTCKCSRELRRPENYAPVEYPAESLWFNGFGLSVLAAGLLLVLLVIAAAFRS